MTQLCHNIAITLSHITFKLRMKSEKRGQVYETMDPVDMFRFNLCLTRVQ